MFWHADQQLHQLEAEELGQEVDGGGWDQHAQDFQDVCARVARNDRNTSEFLPLIPLNDARAVQLARALIGNSNLSVLTIRIGPAFTIKGVLALTGGIQATDITSLTVCCEHGLPIYFARLYLLPIQQIYHDMVCLYLDFPIDDKHAIKLGDALSTGNQGLEHFSVQLGTITPYGARALAIGIKGSKVYTLNFVADPQLDALAEIMQILYSQGVQGRQNIYDLTVSRAIGDIHALTEVIPSLARGLILWDVVELSVSDISILAQGVRDTNRLQTLCLAHCQLGVEHMLVLSPVLGNHRSLQKVDLTGNLIGDAEVAVFVENWDYHSKINTLIFYNNYITSIGAQLLLMALSNHAAVHTVDLSWNRAIGYQGLEWIGQELHGNHLHELKLNYVVQGLDSSSVGADQAKCLQASKALLEGARQNCYIYKMELLELPMERNMSFELDVYLDANKCGRCHLQEQHAHSPGIWSHFLAKEELNRNSSLVFLFLRELPVVMMMAMTSQTYAN